MKVFISWSGGRSRAIAVVLRRWLPSVLQAVQPYFSHHDVMKGTRWSSEIARELEASRVGLLVLTPENQEAPWLLFEAGALAKNLEGSNVCPLLFGGIKPTDVKGPLVQFQAAQFSRDEMKRVMEMINGELGKASLRPEVLEDVFKKWWPDLEEQVAKELERGVESEGQERRPERDLLEEVLALTRRLASDREPRMKYANPVWDELLSGVVDLVRVTKLRPSDDDTKDAVLRVIESLKCIARAGMRHPGGFSRHARHLLVELEGFAEASIEATPSTEASSDSSS